MRIGLLHDSTTRGMTGPKVRLPLDLAAGLAGVAGAGSATNLTQRNEDVDFYF